MHYLTRIETWTLNIVERVQSGAKVEDSRVELKREWIDPQKAARRLAGHANASRGAEVLWIIGLDEISGLVGVNGSEMADWWKQVASCFDGPSPALAHISIQIGGTELVALAFETLRAPFVVRNAAYGKEGAGPVSLEVPYREGTGVRSSTRADLLKILLPAATMPSVDVLGGSVAISKIKQQPKIDGRNYYFDVRADLYLAPASAETIVFPVHRAKCQITASVPSFTLPVLEVKYSLPWNPALESRTDSVTMVSTLSELIVQGPGRVSISAGDVLNDFPPDLLLSELNIKIDMGIAGSDRVLQIALRGKPIESSGKDRDVAWQIYAES